MKKKKKKRKAQLSVCAPLWVVPHPLKLFYVMPPKHWECAVTHSEVVSWRKAGVLLSCMRAMTWKMFWQVWAIVWAHPRGIKYHYRGFTTASCRVNPRSRCEKSLPTLTSTNLWDFRAELPLMERCGCTHIIGCPCHAQQWCLHTFKCPNALNLMFTKFSILWKRLPGIKTDC